jgi:hypothetical protein
MANFWTTRSALTAVFAITLLGTFYVYQSPSSPSYTMSASTSSGPSLEFTLSQSSHTPPTLLVTLKNTSPYKPYTLLKWDTPLDASALNTGVFTIVHADSGEEVQQAGLMINRKMPPPREELVTIVPGGKEEVSVVFDKPWMPEQKPAKYKVKAEGKYLGVWDRDGSDVSEEDSNAYVESSFSGKTFGTEEVVMEVQ